MFVQCDLADTGAADQAVDEAVARLGGLDVLVANAGTIIRKPALEMSLDEFRHVIDVDLVAQWALARAAARQFVAQGGGGAIVLTASVMTFQGGLNVSGYAAAKAGVASLARSFANEWAALGIRVNCVAPGYIANDQTRPLREDPVREPAITSRIPQGRWARDEEIAEAIAWLSSDAASVRQRHRAHGRRGLDGALTSRATSRKRPTSGEASSRRVTRSRPSRAVASISGT